MKRILAVFGVAVACSAGPAQADFFDDLIRGLSATAGVTAPSATRQGQFVLAREPLMEGWRLDWTRTFGPDAFGRPNRIDLGSVELTLLQGSAAIRGDFSRRGLPSAAVSINTPIPISYILDANTGAQDSVIQGTLGMIMNIRANTLGFYDMQLRISNVAQINTDGFLEVNQDQLNFDIGPIDISGNVFFDVLAAVTQPIFNLAQIDNPFSKFSGRATKAAEYSDLAAGLRQRLAAGETLTEQEWSMLIGSEVAAAVLLGREPDLSFLDAVPPGMGLGKTSAVLEPIPGGAGDILEMSVPEPATILLVGAAIPLVLWRRLRLH